MQQRQLRLGDILDDYCPRERRLTNHAVVAMVGADVKQTRCTTCDAEHEYKHAKVPRQRRKSERRRRSMRRCGRRTEAGARTTTPERRDRVRPTPRLRRRAGRSRRRPAPDPGAARSASTPRRLRPTAMTDGTSDDDDETTAATARRRARPSAADSRARFRVPKASRRRRARLRISRSGSRAAVTNRFRPRHPARRRPAVPGRTGLEHGDGDGRRRCAAVRAAAQDVAACAGRHGQGRRKRQVAGPQARSQVSRRHRSMTSLSPGNTASSLVSPTSGRFPGRSLRRLRPPARGSR